MKYNAALRRALIALSLILSAASFAITPYPASAAEAVQLPYDDLKNNFATEAILNMSSLKFITGTGVRRFEPYKAITRAEFVTMIERLIGIKPVSSAIPTFTDVPKTTWFYEWVQPAIQLNLAQGTSPALFEPNRSVTRQEAAVILTRALKQRLESDPSDRDAIYEDQDLIDDWALPSIYRMYDLGLMSGEDGSFRPSDSMTRQEAAVLMNRTWTHPGWSEQIKAAPQAKIQLGWQYGQTTKQFEQQAVQAGVNTLSPRWYFIGKKGAFEDQSDTSLVAWAHKQGKKVWAMVGNHSDQEMTHLMLISAVKRQTLIKELTDRVRKYNIDGINIDFENMMPQDRHSFTAFIAALKQELARVPAVLSVNASPDLGTDWTEVFDYAALAKYADYLLLMGYDEHWGGDPVAGSVSSLPWLKQGIETLLKQVPAEQVILALPMYTRNWRVYSNGTTQSEVLDLPQQNRLVLAKQIKTTWDDQLGQYYAAYKDRSTLNWIWLEDGRSIALKVSLGESYSLAGYGYWYLGGASVDIWSSIRNVMRVQAYHFT
ncbi:glycosyl hydrolase family 18 protein [Paenibacillus sp. R14(2021)]|uniref:glycosyl hydrolase family 18 protein n=1 Tax=Paenibacillus sp. R14(2021) TaxID=2859228 RepID=UPI001C611D75|nr:glycosyl hydrolase family 18 protein [Paenibacillus sp. R14(2021)]